MIATIFDNYFGSKPVSARLLLVSTHDGKTQPGVCVVATLGCKDGTKPVSMKRALKTRREQGRHSGPGH